MGTARQVVRSLGRWVASAIVLAAAAAGAQQRTNTPHIGYVYPAGGQQGTTVEVTVGGQFLGTANAVYVSGKGVQATVGQYSRPMTPREAQLLRDKIEEARKRLAGEGTGPLRTGPLGMLRLAKEAGLTDAEIRALAEFQKMRTDPKRQLNPQIAEKVALQVRIDPDAAPGPREIRLMTAMGLTNPLRFEVSQLRECRETEPNDTTPDTCMGDTLPVIVNGQILPGDVDRFSFQARKGARLVISAEARTIMPYLADAVPGWFQATLTLYDAKGREVGFSDHFRFEQDPVLQAVAPEDGQYVLEVHDSIYRGREDFVYRVAVGELPFVTDVFPLGGRAGAPATVSVAGWNLPQNRLALAAPPAPGTCPVVVRSGPLLSNAVPYAADALPECLEKEPNDSTARAQRLTLPGIVNGRIDRPGDVDVFRFDGRAGQQVVAEVMARRLGSPLDSTLALLDAKGRQVAANDDFEDKGAGLITHQADSRIAVTLPAAGAYTLQLRDAQEAGGPEYAYRLRVSAPRPDFELRVTPSSVSGRAGATVPLTVYVLRRDGFTGDVALSLKGAPPGFWLAGGRVPGSADQVRVTMHMPNFRLPEPLKLELEGAATIGGREVRHTACPAEDMMQAFAYRSLVCAQDWLVAVLGRARLVPPVRVADGGGVKLPAGGTATVRVTGLSGPLMGDVALELDGPPDGITIEKVAQEAGGLAVTLRADAAKAKPGLKGNLIVNALREVTIQPQGGKGRVTRRRVPIDTLPAVPFEVVKA